MDTPRHGAGAALAIVANGEENPVVLADSLAEWLARYRTFGLTEYAIAEGGLDELDRTDALAFVTDHQRLNPVSKWAKTQFHKLRHKR